MWALHVQPSDSITSPDDFSSMPSLWAWIASWYPQAGMLFHHQEGSLLLWRCLEEGRSPASCARFLCFCSEVQRGRRKGLCKHPVHFIGIISWHRQGCMFVGLMTSYQRTCLWFLPREWSAVTLLASTPPARLSEVDRSILPSSEESFFKDNSMLTAIHCPNPNSTRLILS